MTFRKKGHLLVVSGDENSLRQIKEAKPVLEFLKQNVLYNPAPEEGCQYVCDEEDKNTILFEISSFRFEAKDRDELQS